MNKQTSYWDNDVLRKVNKVLEWVMSSMLNLLLPHKLVNLWVWPAENLGSHNFHLEEKNLEIPRPHLLQIFFTSHRQAHTHANREGPWMPRLFNSVLAETHVLFTMQWPCLGWYHLHILNPERYPCRSSHIDKACQGLVARRSAERGAGHEVPSHGHLCCFSWKINTVRSQLEHNRGVYMHLFFWKTGYEGAVL